MLYLRCLEGLARVASRHAHEERVLCFSSRLLPGVDRRSTDVVVVAVTAHSDDLMGCGADGFAQFWKN
jgi:hypothetical protein